MSNERVGIKAGGGDHGQAMGHAYNDRERGVYLPYDLVAAIGGWTQAVVYKHIAYWFTKMGRPIYKGAPELAGELHLSESTVKRAVAELRKLGLITTEVRQANSAPTNHFRVHYEREAELLSRWRNGRPEPSGQNEPNDQVKMSRTITESTNREYKQQSKPSSTFVDGRGEQSTSSARKEPGSPSSLKRFVTADELLSSAPVEPRARTHANNKDDELVGELTEIWNSNRGRLREFRSVGSKRAKNLKRLIRESREAGADPRVVVRLAAEELSKDNHYLTGKYDLENAIQSGRIAKFIDDALEPQAGAGLEVGDTVSWERRPGYKSLGRNVGVIVGFDDRGVPVVKVTVPAPGFRIPELPVGVHLLTKESGDE